MSGDGDLFGGAGRPWLPLCYPGGKARAVKILLPLIMRCPPKRVCSPFFGGGAVELSLCGLGVEVDGYDLFPPVANFWSQILDDRDSVADAVREIKSSLCNETFREMQAKPHIDGVRAAAEYFVLNRVSFNSLVYFGNMRPENARKFTDAVVDRLAAFKAPGLRVSRKDYRDTIPGHGDDFLFLDPPYPEVDGRLYGVRGTHHRNFDHAALADILRGRGNWILTYNNCQTVRDLYAGHKMQEASWHYNIGGPPSVTGGGGACRELIIFSNDLRGDK